MLLPEVEESVHAALARHQRALADVRVVSAALDTAAVPFLVVKGPALVVPLYDGADLRSSVDLDIVVRAGDVTAALSALEAAGCELLDANWPLLTDAQVHELRVLGPTGGAIDLHWSLGPGPGTAAQSPSIASLLARSIRIDIGGAQVCVLDWADTVVHLAVHAASSGGDRLIWCADLRAALAAAPPGGDALLVERAREWRAGPALHLMLVRTQHALGMPLSRDLLAALAPSRAWSLLVRLVDRVQPVTRASGGPSLARMVARSASHDAAASWAALRRKVVAVLTTRGGRATPEQLHDPSDARSGLHPAGGDSGRRAFLAAVTAMDRQGSAPESRPGDADQPRERARRAAPDRGSS